MGSVDGPRAVRDEDRESLDALTSVVFRPGMPAQYPQLYDESNWENLRVVLEDGKCVSHVGMIERDALLFGCRIKTCCIGSVGTLPDYRGKGYAGACLDAVTEKAIADGVDIMIVSGDRNLYRMRGCLRVGRDLAFR